MDLRMPELNTAIVAGRLTRDPETRHILYGAAICNLSLAVSRSYKTKGGDRAEEVSYINIEAWDKQGEYCQEHFRKGAPIIVSGRLVTDQWEDKATGQKRSATKIRALQVQALGWEEKADTAQNAKQDEDSWEF